MGGIGGPELLLVLLVVLLVFGPRKIPEIARGLGRGMREFQRLSTEFQRELNIADVLEGKDVKDVKERARPGAAPEGSVAPASAPPERSTLAGPAPDGLPADRGEPRVPGAS